MLQRGVMHIGVRSFSMKHSASPRLACSFSVRALDEDGHGVPIAFIMLSAPSRNRFTASGYDTAILEKLIRKLSELGDTEAAAEVLTLPVAVPEGTGATAAALVGVTTWRG